MRVLLARVCYGLLQGLDFAGRVCHTKGMEKETLSADVLAFLADLEADLGVPLDFDADDDLEALEA